MPHCSLATVSTNSVTFRNSSDQARIVLSFAALTGVEKEFYSHPRLLVIAAGLLVLSAAAYCSPHRDAIYLPLGGLSLFFLLIYHGTRKAALVFVCGPDIYRTRQGRPAEVTAALNAVRHQWSASSEACPIAVRSKYSPVGLVEGDDGA